MNGDLMSITEAAKKLDIPRSTLSKLLDEAGVQKVKHARETLVSFIDADMTVKEARRAGRVKSRTPSGTGAGTGASEQSGGKKPDDMTLFLMEQVRTVQRERDELADKIRTLERIQGDNKILQLAASEKDRKIAELEAELDLYKKRDQRKGASSKSESSAAVDIKKRASKAINALLGKD